MAQGPTPQQVSGIVRILKNVGVEVSDEIAGAGIITLGLHLLRGRKTGETATLRFPLAFTDLTDDERQKFFQWLNGKGLWEKRRIRQFLETFPQEKDNKGLKKFLKLHGDQRDEIIRLYDPSITEAWGDLKDRINAITPQLPKTAAGVHNLATRYGHQAYKAEKRQPGDPLGPSMWKTIADFLRECVRFR